MPDNEARPPKISISEAVRITGFSVDVIRAAVAAGTLPAYQTGTKRIWYWFDTDELNAWYESTKTK